jgi:cytochrome c551/c552
VTNAIVGPAFREVARKYAGDAGAGARLSVKVRQGGSGVWGAAAMPAQPQVREGDAKTVVLWILNGAK